MHGSARRSYLLLYSAYHSKRLAEMDFIRNNERFHIVCRTHVHQCVKISVILFLVFSVEADFISIVKVGEVTCWIKQQVASSELAIKNLSTEQRTFDHSLISHGYPETRSFRGCSKWRCAYCDGNDLETTSR